MPKLLLRLALIGASAAYLRLLFPTGREGLLAGHAPLNIEAAIALSFLALVCMDRRPAAQPTSVAAGRFERADFLCLMLVTAIAAISFAPNLRAPLVYDDYRQIYDLSHESWRGVAAWFTHPSGQVFYRPAGFVFFWLDTLWAARDPLRWHLASLIWHAANSVLVYALSKQLRLTRVGALVAAALFAVHASRPEAVSWTDARFDPLSTFFVLACLLAANRWAETRSRATIALAVLAAALGTLTKESAFCLPLLYLCLIPFRPADERRSRLTAFVGLLLTCAIVFAYRWWMIGGMGGYRDAGFSVFQASKALVLRLWALLLFPVNWSVAPGITEKLIAAIFVAALLLLAFRPSPDQRKIAALAVSLAAALPVEHLLLIGPDLAGARLLYLPSLGIALFWGILVEALPRPRAVLAASSLLLFHETMLQHNLRPWREVPEAARQICARFGKQLADDPRPAVVYGLPRRRDGVYFLSNGFPACVEFNSGQSQARVHLAGEWTPPPEEIYREFTWNDHAGALEERTRDILSQ